METLDAIGWTAVAVLMLLTFVAIHRQQQKLDDPNDMSVVELETLLPACTLDKPGIYAVQIFRQSGNPYKDDQHYDDRDAAVKAAVSTFKRAKVPYAVIDVNSPTEFIFRRPYFDHRGKAEGKKVGKVVINKIG